MRETDVDLTEYITKGISPNRQQVSQSPGLYECKELMVAVDGLRTRPLIHSLPETFGQFSDYPYPLLFNNISSPLVSNENGTYDYLSEKRISNNITDEAADFDGFTVLNGDDWISEFSTADGYYTDISPGEPSYENFTSVCNYMDAQALGVVGKWLYWSKIGEFNFCIDMTNMAGKISLPFPGEGLKVLQLGTRVVCYGDEGAFVLSPVTQPAGAWKKDKLPQLLGIGLKSIDAVCDIGNAHLFVGNDDNLWKLSADLKLENLGYDHLLEGIEEPTCSYVATYNCTYISNANLCYLYTPQGLSRVQHYSRSILPYFGEGAKIAGYPNVSEGYAQFEVATLPIDFKLRAVKHIQAIEADIRSTGTIECSIDWRSGYRLPFRSTPWVRVNPQGYVQIPCSGVDFRIKFRGPVDSEFYLASLMAKIKYENKTTLRGRYAR